MSPVSKQGAALPPPRPSMLPLPRNWRARLWSGIAGLLPSMGVWRGLRPRIRIGLRIRVGMIWEDSAKAEAPRTGCPPRRRQSGDVRVQGRGAAYVKPPSMRILDPATGPSVEFMRNLVETPGESCARRPMLRYNSRRVMRV